MIAPPFDVDYCVRLIQDFRRRRPTVPEWAPVRLARPGGDAVEVYTEEGLMERIHRWRAEELEAAIAERLRS